MAKKLSKQTPSAKVRRLANRSDRHSVKQTLRSCRSLADLGKHELKVAF